MAEITLQDEVTALAETLTDLQHELTILVRKLGRRCSVELLFIRVDEHFGQLIYTYFVMSGLS